MGLSTTQADHSDLYLGEYYDVGTLAFERMVGHYNQFYKAGDMVNVNVTILKILHIFPMYLDRIKTESGISMRELERMWKRRKVQV